MSVNHLERQTVKTFLIFTSVARLYPRNGIHCYLDFPRHRTAASGYGRWDSVSWLLAARYVSLKWTDVLYFLNETDCNQFYLFVLWIAG